MDNFWRKLNQFFPAQNFIRGVIALIGGTISAQFILVAASPVLTRLYTPSMFGVFSVFLGLSTIFGVLATWRYEIAIPQADNDESAASLCALILRLALAAFGVSMLAVFLFQKTIANVFGLSSDDKLVWFIPAMILITGMYQLVNYWNFRKRRFGIVAKSKINKSLATAVFQLVAWPFGALSLLGGQLLGQLVAALYLSFCSKDLFAEKVSKNEMKRSAIQFRKYPLFSSWSGVLGTAGTQMPLLLLAAFFSPIMAGWYALAFRVVTAPSSLVASSVANVFLPHAADAYREGALGKLLRDIHDVLSQLAMPVVGILAVIAPYIFPVFFGTEWKESGHYVQWLTIMLYANFIYSPVSFSFGVLNRQDVGLVLHLFMFSASALCIWIGWAVFHDALVAVALYSCAQALICIGGLSWMHVKAGNGYWILCRPILVSASKTIMVIAPLLVCVLLPIPLWAVTLLILLCGFFLYLYYRPLMRKLCRPQLDLSGETI